MTDLEHTAATDWVSPPGDTILDRLEELGWSQKELAERLDYTTKHVSLLVNGKAAITEDTALRLERVLGSTARFWLEREAQYQEARARRQQLDALAAEKDWLKELPLRDMVKFGWVRRCSHKGQQVAECLGFFAVASVAAWRCRYAECGAAFRTSPSFRQSGPAVGAWLRQAEREASAIDCAPFRRSTFDMALNEARALTREADPERFIPRIVASCREAGVALVLVPAPKGCRASGAAKWLTKDKAMVALSLRHRSNDHLWFSFFHEAGHIALHGKKMAFIDGPEGLDGEQEQEADRFARDRLIPPQAAERLRTLPPTAEAIQRFADSEGIAPGIVVGRMQKEGLLSWKTSLNQLKVRYDWDHEAA